MQSFEIKSPISLNLNPWAISLFGPLARNSMVDHSDASPLIAPAPVPEPSEIDLEAGPGEQIQCRICLESDGMSHPIYFCFIRFWQFAQLGVWCLIKRLRRSVEFVNLSSCISVGLDFGKLSFLFSSQLTN